MVLSISVYGSTQINYNFGVYLLSVSKVRSLTLDKWTQKMVDNMFSSNTEFNRIWEYHVDPSFMKPTAKTKRSFRSKYINAKYRQTMFHEDNHKRLDPVFASEDYDESEEEKDSDQDDANKSGKKHKRRSTVGMVEYTGIRHRLYNLYNNPIR